MDVEEIAEQLYVLRPDEFIAARDRAASEARRAGENERAKAVAALRRPTLAAWAANLLARQDADQTDRFLQLGRELREAHRALHPQQLRELGHQQHRIIATLTLRAVTLADAADQPLTESVRQQVERVLRAVLADPDIAEVWAAGRLVKVPDSSPDFLALGPDVLPPGAGTDRRTAPTTTATGRTGSRSAAGAEDAAGQRERTRLENARAEADTTASAAEQLERARHTADQEHEQALALLTAAQERIATLEAELHRAREERTAARAQAQRAQGRVRETAKAARAARRAADTAQRTVDTLMDTVDGD